MSAGESRLKATRVIESHRQNVAAGLLCVILAMTVNAQQSTRQEPAGFLANIPSLNSQGTRIAIIYTDFFYDPNIGISRVLNAIKNLDQEFQSRKTEMRRLRQRIEQLTNEMSGSAPDVTPMPVESKRDELEQLKIESQRKAEDFQTEYSQRMRETLNPVLEDLDKAIKSFAQQRGIDLILDGSKMDDALLYMSDGVDLTHVFIVEFNRTNPAPSGL